MAKKAVATPVYWQDRYFQPLVETHTLYGNPVKIPERFISSWEWEKDNARVSRTLAGGSGFLEIYEGASGEHDSKARLASCRFCESNAGNLRRRRAKSAE